MIWVTGRSLLKGNAFLEPNVSNGKASQFGRYVLYLFQASNSRKSKHKVQNEQCLKPYYFCHTGV